MRISRQISTGKILEMQSHASSGTLINNAVTAGYSAEDVEELEMTPAEYSAAMKTQEWGNDLASAQARRIREIKREARQNLAPYDWYVIRKAENGAGIPAPIQAYRSALRQATNDAETAINAMSTVVAVRDYQPQWPVAPGE